MMQLKTRQHHALWFWFFCLPLIGTCHAETATVAVVNPDIQSMIQGAVAQIGKTRFYDGAYRKLQYPGGDIPLETGVCTDVVIRALRQVDIDLQVLVHQDMRKAFAHYPNNWGLKTTDRNIDHRRVPNLQTFFKRQGKALPVTQNPADYKPGDLVTWRLPSNLLHIGIVSNYQSRDEQHLLILHNIGAGTQMEDVLFEFEITGHYRYFPLMGK
ncbi:Uncharacterised protein [Candidatus Venteria ishoeyi]|uniref:DUF1287 domain-containing protein n=1 Tax=Candidatus Venteria ishoeyi TaxID=1899563 RepID=A0A1H6FI38_9GAMM|nr:Uncharacterised protein [Candidatus Venteria ishoeyi]